MSSSAAEKLRQAAHEKKRKEMMEDFDRQKDAIARESERNRTGSDRFVGKTDSMEENLKLQTVGLVYLEDFQQKREALEEEKRRVAARTNELKEEEPKKKKKKKKLAKVKLSFEEEEEEDSERAPEADSSGGDGPERKKLRLLGKNPNVDTSFLPDREREEKERREREELRKKWLQIQDEAKKEDIEITYSRFDGVGHRKEVVCKKGDTIGQFLERVRSQWSELRSISVDNLMYVKEDLILPHHLTFYELILNKARGKSGPLFSFDAHEDVRMIADATVEKDESHAGKVVERIWYNSNKHIFPASRWETYTPGKDYGAYRVKG